jgi:hypothetical protein
VTIARIHGTAGGSGVRHIEERDVRQVDGENVILFLVQL